MKGDIYDEQIWIFKWLQQQKGYIIHQRIGQGLEGIIYRIQLPTYKQKSFALKITKPIRETNQSKVSINRDILKLKLESLISSELPAHPTLPQIKQSGFCKQFGFIVMQYFPNQTLIDFCKKFISGQQYKDRQVPSDIAKQSLRYVIGQIVAGLIFLSENGIVHRDIKMQNIMFDENYKVKIIDFSMLIYDQQTQNQIHRVEQINRQIQQKISENNNDDPQQILYCDDLRKLSNKVHRTSEMISGSRNYLCPETIAPKKACIPLTHKVDIWALGVIAYRIFFGKFPIQNSKIMSNFQLFNLIRQGQFWYPQIENNDKQKRAQIQFVKKCLQIDPQKRSSAKQLLQTQYLNSLNFNRSSINSMRQYILQQHNPILKFISPQKFIKQWKWISQIPLKTKFIKLNQVQVDKNRNKKIQYNKFTKYHIGVKQHTNGHHYLEFTTKKHSKTQQKCILRIKCKWCMLLNNRYNDDKIMRIQISQSSHNQVSQYNIQEINIQIKDQKVVDQFAAAIKNYKN